MRKFLVFALFLGFAARVGLGAETLTPARIVSETSVDCGSKKQGKKESTSLLCQQYIVHTTTTEYQIRQEKPSEKEILPANTPIEFTLTKDRMKFKVNGKKYEFLVVGTSSLGTR